MIHPLGNFILKRATIPISTKHHGNPAFQKKLVLDSHHVPQQISFSPNHPQSKDV
jgi:hypothetical protein